MSEFPGTASGIAFVDGNVLAMEARFAGANTVVVVGDRIAAVGGSELLAAYPGTRRVELAGRTLAPGLIDAHNHLSIAALHPLWTDVSEVAGRDALVSRVRSQAQADPEPEWVRCCGWDETRCGLHLSRWDLDRAGLERPVIIAHATLHQCVVSSAALEVLGIGMTTPDPPGGEIVRRPNGQPTGLLVERAWSAAHARSLAAYAEPDRWAEHIGRRARTLVREGITCVHDAACSPEAEDVYRSMARQRHLPLSVLTLPHAASLLENDPGSRLEGPATGEGDEWLRVGPVKLFADGGVAIALDVRVGGQALQYGTIFPDLNEHALRASKRGFRIAIHAMGNRGVDTALDTMAAVASAGPHHDHRFRVEHVGVSSQPQWKRLASLGAVAVVQPGFVDLVGRYAKGVRFDTHRWLAFAGLKEAGVTLAGSSDDPCAPSPPLQGAALGVTRRSQAGGILEPDQRVSLEEWLEAYTLGAARAGCQEDERGSLAPGKRADLVVLADTLGPAARPRVAETWVAGTRAYRAG